VDLSLLASLLIGLLPGIALGSAIAPRAPERALRLAAVLTVIGSTSAPDLPPFSVIVVAVASPTNSRSRNSPAPAKSPMMTNPVAMPTRHRISTPASGLKALTAAHNSSAARTGPVRFTLGKRSLAA
jgi:hypothetical protein